MKTEPGEYSYDDLVRDRQTEWSGVTSPAALIHMRAVRTGDHALIYHTGNQKQIVGIAQIATDPYPDQSAGDPKRVAFKLKPLRRLATPVTLAQIRTDERFKDFGLVRISRLSVMPVPEPLWKAILKMAQSA